MSEIKANTCPYCGGPYTLAQACHGPRTDKRGENNCEGMRQHARLVADAAEADVTEADEMAADCYQVRA